MLRALPPASVHAIFADPPYNLQLQQELRRKDKALAEAAAREIGADCLIYQKSR